MAQSSADAASGRQNLSSNLVKRVAIVGGTHGNESNGVYLAKHFAENLPLVQRETVATEVLLANVAAIGATPTQARRYVETDLNRCFFAKELADAATYATLEHKRAREIDAQLGPKSSPTPRTDFIFDLHNTTANTGIALMMSPRDAFSHEIGAYLMTLDDDVRIVEWADVDEWGMVPTIARSGLTFEVGACPWSCVVGRWYEKSRRLLLAALDYIDQHNKIISNAAGFELATRTSRVFQRAYTLDYPQTTRDGRNDIDAMIHPAIEGRDFQEIKDGDDLFLKLDGSSVKFFKASLSGADKDGALYPFFLNEAAYYEKGFATMLAKTVERSYLVAVAKSA